MALATLSIDLEARLAKMETQLDKATRLNERAAARVEAQWSKAGAALRGIGLALAGFVTIDAFRRLYEGTVTALDAFNDLADASGSTIENVSALKDVADRTGTSFDTVGRLLVKFNDALTKAQQGSGPAGSVFKALNLDVQELARLDPAEALRRTAVAFDGVAQDGNRARAVQLLFGEQVRESAAFLKDLASSGELNATATTEQAAAAEKFNRQLDALKTNLSNAARGLVGELLPALNSTLEKLAKASELIRSGDARQLTVLQEDSEAAAREINRVTDGIFRMNEELKRVQERGGDDSFLRTRIDKARERLLALQRQAASTRSSIEAIAARVSPLANRSAGNDFGLGGVEGVANAMNSVDTQKAKAVRDVVSEFDRYVEQLNRAFDATQQLSAEEQARVDIALGRLGSLNEAQREQILLQARAIDLAREQVTAEQELAKRGPMLPGQTEWDERTQRLRALIESTEGARANKLRDDINLLMVEISRGVGPTDELNEALQKTIGELQQLGQEAPKAAEQVDRFAEQFESAIQSQFADTLVKTAKGSFDSILDSWGDMLLRMAAEAASAQLMRALFGSNGAGGTNFASLFAGTLGAAATGGGSAPVGPGINFGQSFGAAQPLPFTASDAAKQRATGSTVIYNVAAGVQRNELVQALQTSQQQSKAYTDQALKRAGVN